MTRGKNYPFYNFHGIEIANIHLSDVCNFKCKICNLSEKEKKFVPLAIAKRKIKKVTKLGLGNLIFTGQEVILHPEIDGLIKYAFKECGTNYIVFSTNGLAFSNENIRKKLNSIKKYLDKVYITISVNCYDQPTFCNWSGYQDPRVFKKWCQGFKKAINDFKIDTIDIILKRDTDLIKIWDFLNDMSNGKVQQCKLGILELMPFGNTVGNLYKNLKYRLLEINKKITEIVKKCIAREIQFEYFPCCIYNQEDLRAQKYVFINDYLMFKDNIPVQYDPIIYQIYYDGEIENYAIDKKKLVDAYNKMFCYLKECQNCYYKNKCYGIQREYLKLYSEKEVNKEIKLLKSINWK